MAETGLYRDVKEDATKLEFTGPIPVCHDTLECCLGGGKKLISTS
jgi:hypothetical protein